MSTPWRVSRRGVDDFGVFEAAGGGVDADVEFAGDVAAAGELEGDVSDVLADAGGVGDEDLGDDQDCFGSGHSGASLGRKSETRMSNQIRMTKSE